METNLPEGVEVKFENPDILHKFQIIISPIEGFWNSGIFEFKVTIPEEYNIAVSKKTVGILSYSN